MAEKLIITELEFESIKTALKSFLQTQSTFLDYNFEGSGLAVLINLLAYNTYYNAYYTNMLANELFIDSAQVRNSLLSHSKSLNYTPVSRRSPVAFVNVTITPPGGNTQSVLTLDRFVEFQSEAIDGVNYNFVTLGAQTVFKENGVFAFANVALYEGTPQTATFTYNQTSNPSAQFELPNDDIDTSTLLVTVQVSVLNTSSQVYTLSSDITSLTANSLVYFLSPSTSNKYQLTFGDGAISSALSNGNIVIATYLSTNGFLANRANSFATGSIAGFSNVSVTSVSSASGGAERESDDSIRTHAPLAYTAQGRAVTQKDYESLIKQLYPNIDSVFVWGGEDNNPPVFGKVFLSIAPKSGVILNEVEKTRIISTILDPISIVTVTPELIDPDYVYLKFDTTAEVDIKLTLLTSTQIAAVIRQAIVDYSNATFNQFGAIFVISKFGRAIDDSLDAILGSDTIIRLEKRFIPTVNVAASYTIDFTTSLRHAPINRAMKSTAFSAFDTAGNLRTCFLEEVPNSSTGVDSIDITNAGFNYIEAPTVTITGDGAGATAVATIVNGRVDTITVTNRGTGYTSAIVSITGGGGQAATASAAIQTRYGDLRLYYLNSVSEKVDINSKIGLIDYLKGTVSISNLKVESSLSDAGDIRLSVEPESSLIETTRNQLLILDADDPTSISTSVVMR